MSNPEWKASLSSIEASLEQSRRIDPAATFAYPIRHGSMRAGIYAPRGIDDQTPHAQDELYIVARGSGRFFRGGQEVAINPGDVLFVAAGTEHRFADFSDDLCVWVVFWGPDGGE